MKENLINEIKQIAGEENVIQQKEQLEAFATDTSGRRGYEPQAIVTLHSVEEMEKLIHLAGEHEVPLIPVSSGTPHGRGDTVPTKPGAVIVDLSEMNRILHISRQQRIAVIEPGVTYPQLQNELEKEGMIIASPLAPRKNKSVIASLLEIEPRLNCIHQWNYSEPLRCMGVTWGDGNTIYTGEAGRGPKDLPQQWDSQKWQVTQAGPNMIDFARLLTTAQGTMGIVNWASVKCEVLPTIHKSFFIESEDLSPLIDFMYDVIRPRFSDELFIINRSALQQITGSSLACVKTWIAFCGIAGRELLPERRVTQQEEDIRDIAAKYGLHMNAKAGSIEAEQFYRNINGSDSGSFAHAFKNGWREPESGISRELPFVTTMEKAPSFVDLIEDISSALSAKEFISDTAVYVQPQHCGTSAHMEFDFFCGETSPYIAKEMERFIKKAQEALAAAGAYYSRPYGNLAGIQLNKDSRTYEIQERVRDIFDPHRIMNPGKLSL